TYGRWAARPQTRPCARLLSTCRGSYARPARPARPARHAPGRRCRGPPCPAAWSIALLPAPARSAGTGTTRRPAPWPAAAAAHALPKTSGTSLETVIALSRSRWCLAQGYVTGELVLTAPGGQDGASSPHLDSRAASCPGDNPATSGHRPGIC